MCKFHIDLFFTCGKYPLLGNHIIGDPGPGTGILIVQVKIYLDQVIFTKLDLGSGTGTPNISMKYPTNCKLSNVKYTAG